MEEEDFIKFGDYLKKVRFEKNLTLETIADDIKISIEYLKALEDSNIETFPNEVLAMGFLRTYSEYLDIDIKYISTLFKDYQNKLKNSYIGIRQEAKKLDNGTFSKSSEPIKSSIEVSRIDYSVLSKLLVGFVIILFLVFTVLNIKTIGSYLKLSLKSNRNENLAPVVHEVDFDKENFFNLTLKEGDSLSLIYEKNILRYRVSFLKDELVITNSFGDEETLSIGKSKEINFNQNMKVKIIYDNSSYDNVRANVTLEALMLNLRYVSDTNIGNRFNILDFKLNLSGPNLPSSDFLTVHSSNEIQPVKLNLKFLNNTLVRYIDEENLAGKSLFALKDDSLSLMFEKSLILFFSRLSDVNISLLDKDITVLLKESGKELVAYQFFWLKTPSGFEIKVSEVY